jgi:hypothetical protein
MGSQALGMERRIEYTRAVTVISVTDHTDYTNHNPLFSSI